MGTALTYRSTSGSQTSRYTLKFVDANKALYSGKMSNPTIGTLPFKGGMWITSGCIDENDFLRIGGLKSTIEGNGNSPQMGPYSTQLSIAIDYAPYLVSGVALDFPITAFGSAKAVYRVGDTITVNNVTTSYTLKGHLQGNNRFLDLCDYSDCHLTLPFNTVTIIVEEIEDVTVEAGSFETVKVRTVYHLPGFQREDITWYAEAVGAVKFTGWDFVNGGTITG